MKNHVKKAFICFILALVLLPWPLVLTASADGGAGEITDQCAYDLPEDVPAERLTDGSLLTRLTLRAKKELSVALPACRRPSLYVTWFARPNALTVDELDGEDKLIRTTTVAPRTPFERYELDPACRKAILSTPDTGTISTLRVFDGDLPADLPRYGEPMAQADMLVILGQPQALFEELGGFAPLYLNKFELTTAFCFLNEDSALFQIKEAGDPRPLGEALTALWSLGYTEAPFLGGFVDHDYTEFADVQKCWTDRALEAYLVRLIRTLRPQIIVCAAGGDEDQRSAYAASRIGEAVTAAADETMYLEMGQPHQVQKLYVSDPEGAAVISYEPVYEAAATAYRHLASRQYLKRTLPREGRFTLMYSAVEEDQGNTDLLENLQTDALLSYPRLRRRRRPRLRRPPRPRLRRPLHPHPRRRPRPRRPPRPP